MRLHGIDYQGKSRSNWDMLTRLRVLKLTEYSDYLVMWPLLDAI